MSDSKPVKSNPSVSKIPIRKRKGDFQTCSISSTKIESANVAESNPFLIEDNPFVEKNPFLVESNPFLGENNNGNSSLESFNESTIDCDSLSFVEIHNATEKFISVEATPTTPSKSGKGDLIARKATYTVLNDAKIIAEGGDGLQKTSNEVKTDTIKSCEIITIKEPEALDPMLARIFSLTPFSSSAINESDEFEGDNQSSSRPVRLYPQVLLFVPSGETPKTFVSNFTIANKSAALLAYKICGNRSAMKNLSIEPMNGIICGGSEVCINIRTSEYIGHCGGYCQMIAQNDILEVRVTESVGGVDKRQFFNYWKIVEDHCPKYITVERIRSIKVMEPCNMSILQMLDEGPERDFLEKYLKNEYNKRIPQMLKNRENMKKKQSIFIMKDELSRRTQEFNHKNTLWSIMAIMAWFVALCYFVFPILLK